MARYRLMHCITGTILSGYFVAEAAAEEISASNRRLKETGSCHRYVLDMHAPPLEQIVQTTASRCTPEQAL
jgi:hypothetical protein